MHRVLGKGKNVKNRIEKVQCFSIVMASVWTLFAFKLMSLFFQILVIKVDEKLQVFPDSGISDASDTGFEEAMDVSDGNCDLNFGPVLGNDLIRAISFDHSFNLLHSTISMHILHTVLSKFPKVLTRRIFLTIKCILSLRSFYLFLWPYNVLIWFCGDLLKKN